jgi:hypothetical protein
MIPPGISPQRPTRGYSQYGLMPTLLMVITHERGEEICSRDKGTDAVVDLILLRMGQYLAHFRFMSVD